MRNPVSLRFDIAQVFGIDPRTLALFRVALSLVLLNDLRLRAANIGAFYADTGVLPRAAQIEIYSDLPALLSLHLFNGTPTAQWILFGLAFVAALAMLVGYRTRVATLVSWVLLVSLHNRNPMVLQGGDFLLRMMLFWSLFLPLHARASLDNLLQNRAGDNTNDWPNGPWVSTGTLAALLQVCFVYWFTAAFKSDAAWRSEGSAIGYALSIEQLVKPWGRALLQYPDLMRVLTLFTFNLERFGPWLALLPFWRLRLGMVAVFCGFHLVMGLCLTLGIFTWIAPTAWLLFVPSGAWDWLEARLNPLGGARRATLDALRARWHNATAQSARVARGLGARGPTQTPVSRTRGPRILRQSLAAFFLVYVFGWNLRTLDFPTHSRYFPISWNWIGDGLRLDQMWNMFSPFPFKEDGWFVAPATLQDGQRVNLLFPDQDLNFGRPADLSTIYDPLWQKYLLNMWPGTNAAHRPYFAAYLVRRWNDGHPPQERVQSLELLYMQQTNLPKFRKADIEKIVMWQQNF